MSRTLKALFIPEKTKPTDKRFLDLTGKQFGRWTVLGYAGRLGAKRTAAFRCQCSCDPTHMGVIRSYSLTLGQSLSCGCIVAENNVRIRTTHGLSHSPEHHIWAGMRTRCSNPKVKSYPSYGGRGIKVSKRWDRFENFLADMGPRPSPNHSIERKNNNGDYSKDNCVWLLKALQPRNTRLTRRVVFQGVKRSIHEWEPLVGIPAVQLDKRLRRGWSVERALTQPLRWWP